MDSPQDNWSTEIPYSSAALSPVAQDSPFYNYLSNLSPLKSVKAARSIHRLSDASFPLPQPVFTSPHLHLQRESGILKRDEIVTEEPHVYVQCDTQLNAALISCPEKDTLSCSPSAWVEEYLADPLEGASAGSGDPCLQPANGTTQSLQTEFTRLKETVIIFDDNDDDITETGEFPRLTSQERAAEVLPSSTLDFSEKSGKQLDDKKSCKFIELTSEKVNTLTEPNMYQTTDSGSQHYENYVDQLQNAGGQYDKQDCTSQQIAKSLQIVETYEECDEIRRPASRRSFMVANQYHRGIRRHLTFEAANACKNINICGSNSSNNVLHDAAIHDSMATLAWLGSSPDEFGGISRRAMTSMLSTYSRSPVCPAGMVRPTRDNRNCSTSAPIPTGGLHLNSIGRSVSMGLDMISSLSTQEKLVSERSHKTNFSNSSSVLVGLPENFSTHVSNDEQESQGVMEANSAICQSTNSMKRADDPAQVILIEKQPASCEGNMTFSQDADRSEELNLESPKKKRKKAKFTTADEGCKHCNCKRSRCLKLYCQCFAARIYCVDSCACQNCFNKPEYEDTIHDLRQQIETRDPLAFGPKIVNATDTPSNLVEDGNLTTPSSARHKRGCNCKKSKCLKKYCDCYQAKVGCSDGCRCENCQNAFGTKEETLHRRGEILANSSHEKDTATPRTDFVKAAGGDQFSARWEDFSDLNHLTPILVGHTTVPQLPLHMGSSLQPSSTSIYWPNSVTSFTPQLCGSRGPCELGSESAVYDIVKNVGTPEIPKDVSTPTKAVKISSPNQKRVPPSQSQSEGLRSISSTCLKSGRKFLFQAMPFPPLTPHCNSNEGSTQTKSDVKRSSSDH